jgi:hypothetical protein
LLEAAAEAEEGVAVEAEEVFLMVSLIIETPK